MRASISASVVAALLMSGCGSLGRFGADGTPHPPSPPTAALAMWQDFPANANPRPIIWYDGPNLVKGFPTGDAKVAAYCNKFVLSSGLVMPADVPSSATATWPSGVRFSYHAISASAAFKGLTRPVSGGSCDAPALTVSAVRWGVAPEYFTDRGLAAISSWLFDVDGVGTFGYPGIEAAALWKGGRVEDLVTSNLGAVESSDGLTLTLNFVGAAEGTGPCTADYTASVAESASAVAVALEAFEHGSGACTAMGYPRTLTVHLEAPLGGRVLVDEEGRVATATAT
jgi:hypothetical protein